MKLAEYLNALKKCPEEFVEIECNKKKRIVHKLTAELGVYDNWPIFLGKDFEKVLKDFNYSEDYLFKEVLHTREDGAILRFDYAPGTINLQISNKVHKGLCKGNEKDIQKQMAEYNTTIMLHNYPKKRRANIAWERTMAEVINKLGRYIQKEKIPAGFPRSRGWKNLEDFSKIVYYDGRK